MQAVKNTVAENLGNLVSNSHDLAPKDSRFSLEQVPDLTDKIAVVTGGTEGIGYGCTHTLLSHNISKLFILSPSPSIADEAKKSLAEDIGAEKAEKISWLQCDLSDWDAVRETAGKITRKTERVDILVNNAARGIMSRQLAKNGVDLHMAINHIGHAVLTASLLPLLKQTASKHDTKVRIVNLASNLHEQAPKEIKFASIEELNKDYGPQVQYARTKLCSILFSRYLARHLSSAYPAVLANATHPGIVETRQSSEHIHEAYPVAGYAMSVGMKPVKKDVFEGCVSTMFAATTTDGTGLYICPPAVVEKGSEMAGDEELEERLMDLTWKVVREKSSDGRSWLGKECPFKQH